MKVHLIELKASRALHHFFEAQVRSWLSAIENVFEQRTCPSKKRDRLCHAPNFFFQMKRKRLPLNCGSWTCKTFFETLCRVGNVE
jgi:hypothetical protein